MTCVSLVNLNSILYDTFSAQNKVPELCFYLSFCVDGDFGHPNMCSHAKKNYIMFHNISPLKLIAISQGFQRESDFGVNTEQT